MKKFMVFSRRKDGANQAAHHVMQSESWDLCIVIHQGKQRLQGLSMLLEVDPDGEEGTQDSCGKWHIPSS